MNGRKRYSREELITILQELAKKLGRRPERRDLQSVKGTDYPCFRQVSLTFGTWSKGIAAAGLGDTRRPRKSATTSPCKYCGKTIEHTKGIQRVFCSFSCRSEYKIMVGKDREKSDRRFGKRDAIRLFGDKCERCGTAPYPEYQTLRGSMSLPSMLDVHHIHGEKVSSKPNDLCILCPTCHALATRGITIYYRDSSGKLCWDDLTAAEHAKIQQDYQARRKAHSVELAAKKRQELKVRQSELHGNEHEDTGRNDQ